MPLGKRICPNVAKGGAATVFLFSHLVKRKIRITRLSRLYKIIMQKNSIHYGWYIVAAGILCLFGCLGLGRFAIGMLLPSMGSALELSYFQMGLIGTCNFIGYLIGIVFCPALAKRFGARFLIGAGLFVIGLTMLLIGFVSKLFIILPLYFLTGTGSALANIPVMGLVSAWFSKEKRGRAAGLIVVGNGLAIIFSGKLVPSINAALEQGWRVNWFILGAIVIVVALICWAVLRNNPAAMGLLPVGEKTSAPVAGQQAVQQDIHVRASVILHCAAVYFIFGFTFITYATFIVTSMVQERGFSEAVAGNFWSWIGFLSLFSGPVFGIISDKYDRKFVLALVYAIQAVAYLLSGLQLPVWCLYVAVFCYGIVAFSIPSIMAALVGDYVGPQRAVSVFSFVTFAFALGQISGPFLAGIVADKTGSFSSSFLLASAMAAVAVVMCIALPRAGHV